MRLPSSALNGEKIKKERQKEKPHKNGTEHIGIIRTTTAAVLPLHKQAEQVRVLVNGKRLKKLMRLSTCSQVRLLLCHPHLGCSKKGGGGNCSNKKKKVLLNGKIENRSEQWAKGADVGLWCCIRMAAAAVTDTTRTKQWKERGKLIRSVHSKAEKRTLTSQSHWAPSEMSAPECSRRGKSGRQRGKQAKLVYCPCQ